MNSTQVFIVHAEASNTPFLMTTNPTKSAQFIPDYERLVEACGVLPQMLISSEDPESPMKTNIENSYPFGAHWNDHGVVDDQGIYRHPEDPPLEPVAQLQNVTTNEVAYIYTYGLVAVCDDNGKFITGRFD